MTAQTLPREAQAPITSLDELRRAAFEEVGRFAWTTFWLATGTIVAIVTFTGLALAGIIPLWLGGLLNLCGFASGYTVAHEIIHDNLIGKHRHLWWLNKLFGTAFFSVPLHSLTMHTYIHTRHHAYTNDESRDPDRWINGRNPIKLLFRLVTHYAQYHLHVLKWTRGTANRRKFLTACALEEGIPMIVAAGLMMAGFAKEVALLWLMPSLLVYPTLAFILDWVPHQGLPAGTPCQTTRILGAPKGAQGLILTWLYLFQNYHLIHHLWPRVPFYRYTAVYNRGTRALEAAGAEIYPGFRHHTAQPVRS
jgi:beta-carotene hydroxylase